MFRFNTFTVKTKLNILNVVIIISGVFGVIGAFEIAKGAKLHELNFLHVKYNHVFSKNVDRFSFDNLDDTEVLARNVRDIRQQPIDCLKVATWFERSFMKLIGTYEAIVLCQKDIELGDKTLINIEQFNNQRIDKEQLETALLDAVAGFDDNSEKFEPYVSKTVSLVLNMMITLIVIKAILVALIGYVLSRSLGDDYQKLADTEASLAERTSKLEEKNSALEQFSYHTSHDLKSPLTSIRGLTQYISKDIEHGNLEEAKANVFAIEKLALRGEELIQDILKITRSDTLSEPNSEIDVERLVDGVIKRLSLQAKEKGVLITKQLNHQTKLFCQTSRIQQALDNLVSNSIKYSDPKSEQPRVEINTQSNDGELTITVKDNGLGIPKHLHSQVFNMFARFHSRQAEGSGLGLYLVKKHIARINGMISFTSEPGNTSFILKLPVT